MSEAGREAGAVPAKRGPGRPKGSKTKRRAGPSSIPVNVEASLAISGWQIPERQGRPTRSIDYAMVEKLASIGCSVQEIKLVLGITDDKLRKKAVNRDKFNHAFELGMTRAKMSLRRAQYIKAVEEREGKLLIWMGKQMLGQREQMDITASGDSTVDVKHTLAGLTVEELRRLAGVEEDAYAELKQVEPGVTLLGKPEE